MSAGISGVRMRQETKRRLCKQASDRAVRRRDPGEYTFPQRQTAGVREEIFRIKFKLEQARLKAGNKYHGNGSYRELTGRRTSWLIADEG